MNQWLSAAAGAIATGIFALIVWFLNRKAAKNDKRDEKEEAKKEAQEKALMARFEDAVTSVKDFAVELGLLKADILDLKESNRRQDNERKLDKALDARRRILRFADEVRRGEKHSLEHFNNVFIDVHNYEAYCNEHPDFKNNRADVSIKCIQQVYEQCTLDNSFL